jgi:hypothetical protein
MNEMTVEPVEPTKASTRSSFVMVIDTKYVPSKIPMVMAMNFIVEGGDCIFVPLTSILPDDNILSSEFLQG